MQEYKILKNIADIHTIFSYNARDHDRIHKNNAWYAQIFSQIMQTEHRSLRNSEIHTKK